MEEFVELREGFFWGGLVCTLLNSLVFFTFVIFEEKRRPAWSPLNFAFTLSAFFFSLMFTLGVGIPADDLIGIPALCGIAGSLLFFFAASLIFLWSFITIHLYVRIVRNQEVTRVAPMVAFSYGGSVFAATIPNIVPGFQFNGAFCMIPYDNVLWKISIGFFLSCALIGIFFWLCILYVVVAGYWDKKSKAKKAAPRPSVPSSPYHYSASYPYPPSPASHGDTEAVPSPPDASDWKDKYLLVFRQFVFVTAFLLALLVLVGVHLGNLYSDPHLAALLECTTVCIICLDSFLVFGVNKQNFDLWRNFICARCCRRPAYSEIE